MAITVLIDYGSGNLHSAHKALERMAPVGMEIHQTNDPVLVEKADRLVLPGVGAFGDCRQGIDAIDGLHEAITVSACNRAIPFLGICVGMQLMAETGYEYGTHQGFGWLQTSVRPLTLSDPSLKTPHMGWNTLILHQDHPIVEGIEHDAHAYFVHSFHMVAEHDTNDSDWLLASTEYGGRVTAVVGRDNLVGTQFHPEKSQATGLQLLHNFLRWNP